MAKVTIRQIAERVGYSMPTVSQVLNGNVDLYKEETVKRILSVARTLDYRPNAAARTMISGRSNYIGILTSSNPDKDSIFPRLMAGIQTELQENDLHMSLTHISDKHLSRSAGLPRVVRELSVDSFIVAYMARIPATLVKLINELRTPAIWINSKHHGDCVYADDYAASRTATQQLLALGHRRIAFVNYCSDVSDGRLHYSVIDRHIGYRSAMEAAGLPPRLIGGTGHLPLSERIAFTRAWLELEDRPTAILAHASTAAIAVAYAAAASGLVIPDDFSIATFHDADADDMALCLATMQSPIAELGKAAVAQTLTKLDKPLQGLSPVVLPYLWQTGESLAPPRHC